MQLDGMRKSSNDGDRWCTSNAHGAYGIECLLACFDFVVVVLVRQAQLVENQKLTPRIADGFTSVAMRSDAQTQRPSNDSFVSNRCQD